VEFIDADEHVIVIIRISGRGKRSGASVELTLVSVGSVRNGKTVRVRNYPSRDGALEAGVSARTPEMLATDAASTIPPSSPGSVALAARRPGS
jgi:hypothetical protein